MHQSIACDHVGVILPPAGSRPPHTHPASLTIAAAGADILCSLSPSKQVPCLTPSKMLSASLTNPPKCTSPSSKNTAWLTPLASLPKTTRRPLSSAHRNSDFGARVYLIEKKDGVKFGNGNTVVRNASFAILSGHSFRGAPTCEVCHTNSRTSSFLVSWSKTSSHFAA